MKLSMSSNRAKIDFEFPRYLSLSVNLKMNQLVTFFHITDIHYFVNKLIKSYEYELIVTDSYSDPDVRYIWTHGVHKSIKMASDMRLSQLDLISIPHGNQNASQPHGKHLLGLLCFMQSAR